MVYCFLLTRYWGVSWARKAPGFGALEWISGLAKRRASAKTSWDVGVDGRSPISCPARCSPDLKRDLECYRCSTKRCSCSYHIDILIFFMQTWLHIWVSRQMWYWYNTRWYSIGFYVIYAVWCAGALGTSFAGIWCSCGAIQARLLRRARRADSGQEQSSHV